VSYNVFNKPKSINRLGSQVNLFYDASWSRYKQTRVVNGQTITTHYINKLYEVEFTGAVTSANAKTSSYISDVAILYIDSNGESIRFTHKDRLGSSTTFTDSNGNLMQSYGVSARLSNNLHDGDMASRRGFTDHEHLDEVELIHMNGRVYDYNVGRFMSVDPFIHEGSQGLNPYSYIMNNPLAGVDPTGYKPETMTGSRIPGVDTGASGASFGAKFDAKNAGSKSNGVKITSGSIIVNWQATLDLNSQEQVATAATESTGGVDSGTNGSIDITKEQVGIDSGDNFENNSFNHTPFSIDSSFSDMSEETRHHYDLESFACSTSSNSCTLENMRKVVERYSYPNFFLAEAPANFESSSLVAVTTPDANFTNRFNYVIPGGLIEQSNNKEGGIMNNTLRGHVVFPGIVIRQAIERGGNIYIQTHGIGYNRFAGEPNNPISRRINKYNSVQNDIGGPKAFKALDVQAIQYYKNNF
jgi:RHS repeat-associated protein